MFALNTIARPYAKAVFEFSIKNNTIKKWKEMLIFMTEISSFQQIKHFLSGAAPPKYLSSVFIFIGGDKFDQHGKNFIKLLAYNQRLSILKNILEQFLALNLAYQNVIPVELTSAFILKKDQIDNINNILKKNISKKICFTSKIDISIIDGVIVKIYDTVFDLSIRHHLKQLSNVLKSQENNNVCN